VILDLPTSGTGRRLLSGTTITYTIKLTPAQAASAPAAASAIAQSVASGSSTFVDNFVSEAAAVGALTSAISQYLSASGSTPSVIQAPSAFAFLVADSTGPTLSQSTPAHLAQGVNPSTDITLVFSESVQAGQGVIVFDNDNEIGVDRFVDVTDTSKVHFNGATVRIQPRFWFAPGTVSVTMASGVITDAPHYGTPQPLSFLGISGGAYQFQTAAAVDPSTGLGTEAPNPTQNSFLDIGVAPGTSGCSYTLTHPYYTCHDFTECTVFVKPDGSACGAGPATQIKRVTMTALRRIAEHGQERNGGDGRDTILNYGGGQRWPDNVVSEFSG